MPGAPTLAQSPARQMERWRALLLSLWPAAGRAAMGLLGSRHCTTSACAVKAQGLGEGWHAQTRSLKIMRCRTWTQAQPHPARSCDPPGCLQAAGGEGKGGGHQAHPYPGGCPGQRGQPGPQHQGAPQGAAPAAVPKSAGSQVRKCGLQAIATHTYSGGTLWQPHSALHPVIAC